MAATEVIWSFFKAQQRHASPYALLQLKNQIAVANRGLVRDIARRYAANSPVPVEDLEQIGMMGLLNKAIPRFDPTTGNAFSSFAVPWIRGEILHYLRDHGSTVKIPRRWRELNAAIGIVEETWLKEKGRQPTVEEVSTQLQISAAQIMQAREGVSNQKAIELDEERDDQAIAEGWAVDYSRLKAAWSAIEQQWQRMSEEERSLLYAVYVQMQPRKLVAQQQRCSVDELRRRLSKCLDRLADVPLLVPA